MINDGSLLRPDGWKKAAQLFERENPGPPDATIFVTTKHPIGAGPPGVQGGRAEADEKWVDDLGTIGPDLSYKPPPIAAVEAEGNIFIWHLIRVDKHRRITKDERSEEQVDGQPDWRIEGALTLRWASREAAIRYLRVQREKTNDSHIRENADRTIAILKGLRATA